MQEHPICSICRSVTTYIDKTKWGPRPHWRHDSLGNQICGKCYGRVLWKKKIPVGVRCDLCKTTEPTKTKYGTSKWVRNWDREGGYLCRRCYITQRDSGIIFSEIRRKNISIGIRRALDAGAMMGPKIHSMDETIFDAITEESAYWVGYLMADGNIHTGKTGNPRISLTLAKEDRDQLIKFKRFLNCSNLIQEKISRVNRKVWIQYTVRFSSKHIANALIGFGVTHRKSPTAKVIRLQNDRHFWRGVLDGDGHIKNKDGVDGDRMVAVGSHHLMHQLKEFVECNIPGSTVRTKNEGNYSRLYVYSYTARMLAELLYANCSVALDRKLAKALKMVSTIQ